MTRFPGAPRGSQLVIVGDEAWSAAELEAREKRRAWEREYKRARYASDPAFRERRKAAARAWKFAHRERAREHNRESYRRTAANGQDVHMIRPVASLHDLRCTGPTRSTGCRCHKVTIYERVESAA